MNAALQEVREEDEFGAHTVALVLNHSFPLLSDWERSQLDYELLLPVLVGSAFFSSDGLQSAYFLASIDLDLTHTHEGKIQWSSQSTSAHQLDRILSRPLVSSLGPLSRLISHAIDNVRDPWLIQTMTEDISSFTRALFMQWRQSRLSVIDTPAEKEAFTKETLENTSPKLWKLLRSTLFAIVIILRGVLGRLLSDSVLSSDAIAPVIATQTLHALRHIYFITMRLGTNSFSQYTFISFVAIDILSKYHMQASSFLQSICPSTPGSIPESPLERTMDLYFLNTA